MFYKHFLRINASFLCDEECLTFTGDRLWRGFSVAKHFNFILPRHPDLDMKGYLDERADDMGKLA
jgi:hypothetical protein